MTVSCDRSLLLCGAGRTLNGFFSLEFQLARWSRGKPAYFKRDTLPAETNSDQPAQKRGQDGAGRNRFARCLRIPPASEQLSAVDTVLHLRSPTPGEVTVPQKPKAEFDGILAITRSHPCQERALRKIFPSRDRVTRVDFPFRRSAAHRKAPYRRLPGGNGTVFANKSTGDNVVACRLKPQQRFQLLPQYHRIRFLPFAAVTEDGKAFALPGVQSSL